MLDTRTVQHYQIHLMALAVPMASLPLFWNASQELHTVLQINFFVDQNWPEHGLETQLVLVLHKYVL